MKILENHSLENQTKTQRPTYDKIKGMAPMPHKSLTRLMFAGASRSWLTPVLCHLRFLSMLIPAPFDIILGWSTIDA
jgi:hypothetical protein